MTVGLTIPTAEPLRVIGKPPFSTYGTTRTDNIIALDQCCCEDVLDRSARMACMSGLKDYHYIDAPVAPALKTELVEDRRRLGRIHYVSPALIQLLRNAATAAIVYDIYPTPVADVIVPMPGATENVLQGNRFFGGSLAIWSGASLGIGIFTAATIWFGTGHGSSIALAVGNLLRFIYGIGILM